MLAYCGGASSSFVGVDSSIARQRPHSIVGIARSPFIPSKRNIYQEHASTAYPLDNETPCPLAGAGAVRGD